jgi:hypothetical protein
MSWQTMTVAKDGTPTRRSVNVDLKDPEHSPPVGSAAKPALPNRPSAEGTFPPSVPAP